MAEKEKQVAEIGLNGVIVEEGPMDWQILQRDAAGVAEITLSGKWVNPEFTSPFVRCRVAHEDSGSSVTAALDWVEAEMLPGQRWRATLKDVPAGGLYRLETHLAAERAAPREWCFHGDMVHHLGVGDLWVIAGQSNSAGYGRGAVHDPPELGIHLFRNRMVWDLATHPMNESTRTAHPENREGANPGHSPYLAFARALKAATGFPQGLVQTSLGGSPLSAWNPTEPGEHPLYDGMLRTIRTVGGRIRGILWYQGCSDTASELAPTYLDRFVSMVGAWRRSLGDPKLPMLTVQLNRVQGAVTPAGDLGWSLVREAQRQAPRRLHDLYVVPTLDLPLSDGIHLSPAANMSLGLRLADVCLGALEGRHIAWRAPEIGFARTAADGRSVELVFEHVTDRMASIDPLAQPFAVEDAEGSVPITEVAYTAGATVALKLGRALRGKGMVHGAACSDPDAVPFDMGRMVPMLGFHGVAIG
jgi:sialate O-acetylesterase